MDPLLNDILASGEKRQEVQAANPVASDAGQGFSSSIKSTGSKLYHHVDSSAIYGMQPAWGWDYVFVFQAPKFAVPPPAAPDSVAERVRSTLQQSGLAQLDSDAALSQEGSKREQEAFPTVDDSNACYANHQDDPKVAAATQTRLDVLSRLQSAGFSFSQMYVPTEDAIFLRLGLSQEKLMEKAEHLRMELPLKPEYGGGYLAFSQTLISCFHNGENTGSFFLPADRILIILGTLQSKEAWGCGLNLERLVFKNKVLQAFAIHSKPEQDQLVADVVWARLWFVCLTLLSVVPLLAG
jgi:hypothetical protein